MKILLTGATGFLGSHVLLQLVRRGYSVLVVVRKTSRINRISSFINLIETICIDDVPAKDIFMQHDIDLILHCATDYGRKQIDPADLCESNLIFPLRLLQYGRNSGVKYFINTDTILDKRVNYYSLSKNQFKDWLNLYSHDMVCINVALEHFYGPDDDPTKFVSFLVNNLVRHVPSIDLTKGEQKRNFVFIDDVVDAFVKIIGSTYLHDNGYFHYEIGSNANISIRAFAELVKELSGAESTFLNFGALPYRENEVMEAFVDLYAIKALGWVPKTSLEAGIEKTINAVKKLRKA